MVTALRSLTHLGAGWLLPQLGHQCSVFSVAPVFRSLSFCWCWGTAGAGRRLLTVARPTQPTTSPHVCSRMLLAPHGRSGNTNNSTLLHYFRISIFGQSKELWINQMLKPEKSIAWLRFGIVAKIIFVSAPTWLHCWTTEIRFLEKKTSEPNFVTKNTVNFLNTNCLWTVLRQILVLIIFLYKTIRLKRMKLSKSNWTDYVNVKNKVFGCI